MTTKRIAGIALCVFCGWIATMAAVMRFSDAAPAAVAFFPPADFVQNLPAEAALISASPITLTISGDVENMGQNLYHAGAWLVLPAGLTGCLPLPKNASTPAANN